MSSAPNFNYFTLTGPNRLVIDLKGASNATNLARIENKSELVRKIRESTPLEKGGLRLVLDLGSAIKSFRSAMNEPDSDKSGQVIDAEAPTDKDKQNS